MSPGVGEGVRGQDLQSLSVGLVAEDAGVLEVHRPPRRFHLGVVEGAFLEAQRAARGPGEGADRMVAVLGAEAREHDALRVGAPIAVGVLQVHEVRLLGHVDPTIPQLETGGHMQALGELDVRANLRSRRR